jgi:N-acetylmuramoyl-L-alanine amidase
MKRYFTSFGIVMFLTAMAGLLLRAPRLIHAEETDFPVYFADSTLVLKTQIVNRIPYLPLADIVRHLNLPYTNDSVQEVFTIRGANAPITLTRNSAAIAIGNQVAMLPSPVLHENGAWLVPVEFLTQGLSRITGAEFRRKAGTPRVFAGGVKTSELAMTAQTQAALTRLTLRTSTPVTLELRREVAQHRAYLTFAPKPLDPAHETLDFKDHLLSGIDFNDSDGNPKVVVETSDDVSDIRVLSADENHVHFIDFLRKPQTTDATPSAAGAAAAGAVKRTDPVTPGTRTTGVRVIVIDPGHGGTDAGASTTGVLEKDVTLALARKVRATLQARLGATVLLTRDSDVALTSEARASVANNNRADLFISLHIGYSANKADLASSVYVIEDNFAASLLPEEKGQRLFLPWYLGYRTHREASVKIGGILGEELSKSLPGWLFPVRYGPVAVLASTTMPSVLVEIGNINNPASTQALLDNVFQAKLGETIATAIERFSPVKQAEK